MKKYNVDFPIAGVLHFYDVEADNKKEAIEKCYELVSECSENGKDHMREFDGEWDMYEKICEGNVLNTPYNNVDVEEVEDDD